MKILFSFLFFMLLVLNANSALAVSANTVSNQTASQTQAKAKTFAEKCKQIDLNVTKITATQSNRYDAHVQAYNNFISRIEGLIVKAKAAGTNTAKLESDLAALKEKVQKLKTDFAALQTMHKALSASCSKPENDFRVKLAEAKQQLQIVKTDISDIKSLIKTTIRQDLLVLKEQKKNGTKTLAPTSSTDSTKTTTTSGKKTKVNSSSTSTTGTGDATTSTSTTTNNR